VRTLLIKDAKNLLLIPHDTATMSGPNYADATVAAISSKALKNFGHAFKGVTNVSWAKISDGFSAYFIQNGNVNRSYFDKKGNLMYTVVTYDGSKLPRDVRAIVKSKYYDCEIPLVEEIHTIDQVVYLVHLKDDSSWKKVKVCDGDMQLLEDFEKK
jgi:hypothetical protein